MWLQSTWFFLWGILWALYFILDGFDLGLGSLMPFLAKNERDKKVIYNSMGPFWDGNEVWLITAGGVTFAAFPATYAVMFSGLYTALMLLLFALIIRGVAFEFRSKMDNPQWAKFWDICMVVGSFLPALLLGVAFANIFKGLPFDAEGVFHGNLFTLLNPYGLAGGILFVLLFALHGALWLSIKATDDLKTRAINMARKLWPVTAAAVVLFLPLTYGYTKLFNNYLVYPVLFVVLLIPVVGLFMTRIKLGKGNPWAAWGFSAMTIGGIAIFGIIGLYPALLISSINPGYSMTISNSSSSMLTLKIMLGVALTFVPIVLLYQAWVYKTFGHPITDKDLEEGLY